MQKRFIIMCLIVLVYGCASAPSGGKFSSVRLATTDKALVYIYRPDARYAKALTHAVLFNEVKIADIARNGFFSIDIPPGEHSFRPNHSGIDHDLIMGFDAGSTTFLRLQTNLKPALCFCTSIQFEVVSRELAEKEMKTMRQEVDRVYFK